MASTSNQVTEFTEWMDHVDELYNFAFHHCLEWPSVTVEWLPHRQEPVGEDHALQSVLVGTQTENKDQNYLSILELKLPFKSSNAHAYDAQLQTTPQVQGIRKINVDADIHRARYMPTDPSLIATKAATSEVYLFDCRRQPTCPLTGVCNPDLRLRGHTDEGFALSWSQLKPGHLLSGGHDGKICVWDINKVPENKVLNAMETCKVRRGTVEDVAWNKRHDHLFGSVGTDRQLLLWDLRTVTEPSQTIVAHDKEVNCLAFDPFNEWMVITGSEDSAVKLFDLRSPINAVHTFHSHLDGVLQVGWNPAQPSLLASSGRDQRVMVWDFNRKGKEQTPEEALEGPPELVFVHGGHTNMITDFAWNPCEEWLLASVGGDNILQIWQVGDHVYAN